MYYAIIYNGDEAIQIGEAAVEKGIYNGDEAIQIGEVTVEKGVLLGYTEFPDDESFAGKPYLFVEVTDANIEPLRFKYVDEEFVEIG